MEEQVRQADRQLEALLTDFNFVQAKVQAGMTFDLVRVYQAALLRTRSAALESWARFINREEHILSRHPFLFFQQALNQPADSPVAQAAAMHLNRHPTDRPYVRWLNKPEETAPSRLLRTLTRHTEGITALAVTPDGRSVISGSWDYTLKLWDLESGQEVTTFQGFVFKVNAVAVTPDGRFMIAGSDEGHSTVTADGLSRISIQEDPPHTLDRFRIFIQEDSRHYRKL
jgi:WD40 repeat protein